MQYFNILLLWKRSSF